LERGSGSTAAGKGGELAAVPETCPEPKENYHAKCFPKKVQREAEKSLSCFSSKIKRRE